MGDYKRLQTIEDLELYIRESTIIAKALAKDLDEYDEDAFKNLYEIILDLFEEIFHLISGVCADVDTENPLDLTLQVFQTVGVHSIQKIFFEKSQKDDLITVLHVLFNVFVNALMTNGENRYGVEWPRGGYFIVSHYVMDRTSDDMISFAEIIENISREKLIDSTAATIGFLIKSDISKIVEDSY